MIGSSTEDLLDEQAETIEKLRAALRRILPDELSWKEEGGGVMLISVLREDLRAARKTLKA